MARPRGGFLIGRSAPNALRQIEGELDIHVRLEERPLDVTNDLREEGLVDGGAPGDLLKHPA